MGLKHRPGVRLLVSWGDSQNPGAEISQGLGRGLELRLRKATWNLLSPKSHLHDLPNSPHRVARPHMTCPYPHPLSLWFPYTPLPCPFSQTKRGVQPSTGISPCPSRAQHERLLFPGTTFPPASSPTHCLPDRGHLFIVLLPVTFACGAG